MVTLLDLGQILQKSFLIGLPSSNGITTLSQAASTGLRIQLAPSVHHQAAAIVSLMLRYNWSAFAILTSQIAGHVDFVLSMRTAIDAVAGDYPDRWAGIGSSVEED